MMSKHSKLAKEREELEKKDNNNEDELQGCKVPFPLLCFQHFKLHDYLYILCMHVWYD